MVSKIKKITQTDYNGKVYDLSFNVPTYFFVQYNQCKANTFIKVKNCDIDWDSETGARDHILNYLVSTYGQESVCNVATFGTFGAKSALQSMSRGLRKETGHDTTLMRKITKLEGLEKAEDLNSFFEKVRINVPDEEIVNWIDNNQDTIEYANRIQGQMTQLGMHAGGIVVTPGPIYNYIPITRGSGNLVTAFREADGSSKDLSELGILKLDVLGLRTLNLLKSCVENIKIDKGIDLRKQLNFLDVTDKNVLQYFAKQSPYGIFQMDRAEMFTSKINVDSFDDIVAINALNRPGPLEKYLNKYGYWKGIDKGEIKINDEELEKINQERYPFPFMEKVLKRTYGCLIYQEQFMLLVKEAAGFDMGEADNFRRGIAWLPDNPKYYTVAKYFEKLEAGMIKKGYKKEDVGYFVQYCRDFLGYSFNLAHATTYGYIAFQTLYFKCYYPAYFYAAMINLENDIDKFQEIIADAEQNGIKFLPQSITKSAYLTKVESDNSIRLGIGMIKGMGESVSQALGSMNLVSYSTLGEVLQQDFGKVNKTQFENLIDIGAFDEFEIDRDKVKFLRELYSDDSIEKWFTRQKQTLRLEVIPKILKDNFNPTDCLRIAMRVKNEPEPWKLLLTELINQISFDKLDNNKYAEKTIEKQRELIGFSLYSTKKLDTLLTSLRIKGLKPLSNYENEDDKYFFIVDKASIVSTKTQKKYLQLVLNDGNQVIKAKCWKVVNIEEGKIYSGKFKKDKFGYTLNENQFFEIN